MLKGIDPLLAPGLLGWLGQMGHGDVLAVVDRNYPCHGRGQRRVWEAPGQSVDDMVVAVLGVMPLDAFVDAPLVHMLVDDGSDGPALAGIHALSRRVEGREVGTRGVRRDPDFYDEAATAYATVHTGDDRPQRLLPPPQRRGVARRAEPEAVETHRRDRLSPWSP